MTNETTVSMQEEPGKKPAHDLAPAAPAETLGRAAGELDAVIAAKAPQALVHLEPVTRKKTWGEHVFDGVTYGGSYWIATKDTDESPTGPGHHWRLAIKGAK